MAAPLGRKNGDAFAARNGHLVAARNGRSVAAMSFTRAAPGATAGLSSSAVWERLTWLVQPFSGEALDDWQAGVLLQGIKKVNSWTWPGAW
jgi:hypothetical protein